MMTKEIRSMNPANISFINEACNLHTLFQRTSVGACFCRGIIRYSRTIAISKPAHVMRPEILLPVLEPLVFFQKEALEALRNLKVEREKSGTV